MKDADTALILPFMGPFYDRFAKPLAFVGLRLVVGWLLVVEGWPKIQDPFGMAGFTEALGLYPGRFWSAVLAVLQFGGGLLILVGFLTRPAALANGVMLAVTYWFHLTHPYGDLALTQEGISAAQVAGQTLFTADGIRNLAADGGAVFLHQVQFKAEGLSAIWTVATLFLAAFGAGPLSVDRTLLKREF
ncbi:DoxX family protein [Paracoccus sp. 11-3]|uniref:DoxX family protein n=1 Tax=Paracoccus amoyensis TaxID=2760093 RepID=A0A926JDV9_9RHOB|nr:DoxX family protein [Paracoccus amoyensis]MBC9247463.1 DoxX family protein [Paracoccus amoyensis]